MVSLLQSALRRVSSWYWSLTQGGAFRTNLARGKPATQSSVSARWSSSQDPQQEARGANNGVIDGSQGFTTDEEHFPWWQVDLGRPCNVEEIRIFNRHDWAFRLAHFSILVSLDAKSWMEVYRKSDDYVFGDKALIRPFVVRLPPGRVGRFVRIRLNGTDSLHFNECLVFGRPVPESDLPEVESGFSAELAALQANVRPVASLSKEEIEAELMFSQLHYPFPQSELRRTQARRWILDYAPTGRVGAEIGVFRGHFSEVLLERLTPSKLYLVDPWEELGEYFPWSDAYTSHGTLPTRVARRDAELRAARFPATETIFVQGGFPECRGALVEPLDWIYIDASHEYNSTLAEITVSAELLKPGGIILGDDYYPDPRSFHHGVFRAVNAFVKSGLFEFVAGGPSAQWCIRRTAVRDKAADFEGADRRLARMAARLTGRQLDSPRHLLGFIAEFRELRSAASFGCGRASWLHAARALGAVEIRGYDAPGIPLDARGLRPEEFQQVDLAQPISLEKRFDIAVCVDTPRDLAEPARKTLVASLCQASDWVLFCAPVPYQDGASRSSAAWPEYWAALFAKRGFACYDILRTRFWHDTRVAFHYRQGACLYIRGGTHKALKARGFRPTSQPPALIHPELLLRAARQGPPAGYQLGGAVQDFYRSVRKEAG